MSNDMVLQDKPDVKTEDKSSNDENDRRRNNLNRYDSFDIESAKIAGAAAMGGGGWATVLHLAFQSIGVVFGDIGTSPLYVFPSIFSDGIKDNDDILGALSLIFYTITLLPLIKYVLVVLRANDNGEGGTFALYSLICRYAKVGLLPSQEIEDHDVSTFKLELPSNSTRIASKLKSKLEKSVFAKYALLLSTMLGTSMLIGDGILTPCISVLSATSGMKEAAHSMTEDTIVWTSVGILVVLFMVQRFGTDKVGSTFAPILLLWFFFISSIGIYNFIKYDPSVIKAVNPKYIIDYFMRNKREAWISLGGVVLCITGAEALFADLGHFSVKSIQISMSVVVYPSIILAYIGQASFLRENNSLVSNAFYASVPKNLYWPMFVVAVMAAIIASQALISGTFSIIQQSLAIGCFPRVKIVHTSTKYPGQVYIPEINYLLMFACVFITLGFRTTTEIGNAYGIAVVFVMVLTSGFLVLIMTMIWETHILVIISYVLIIGSIELLYLSSVLYKFDQGGYLPLAFAAIMMTIMFVWNDVYRKKYYFELQNKISPDRVMEIVQGTRPPRLSGLAIFYSELVHGIPPIFNHYVSNVPALHSVLVFVSFKSLPISKVPIEERFLFRRVKPKELQVFRCVVRYGYTDARSEEVPFEQLLFERLKEYIREDYKFSLIGSEGGGDQNENRNDNAVVENDIEILDNAWQSGVVHLVGTQEVVAAKGSNFAKKVVIDYAYNFLKKNVRQSNTVFDIPQERMLKVGMTYEL
ncbi:hypothetical protein ACS0TY_012789 [Phlomoides rotata]